MRLHLPGDSFQEGGISEKETGNKNDGPKPAVLVLVSSMPISGSDYLPKRHTRPVSIRMLFWEAPPKCV